LDPVSPLLALRLGDCNHALEPGREYLLGGGDDCDLRIRGAEAVHARLSVTPESVTITDLSAHAGILHNEERVQTATLRPGDRIAISDEFLIVIVDDGTATLLPVPALRNAAAVRRAHRIRSAASALRHQEAQTFSQMMASEMRRAPWLMLSLVAHLLLVILLWWSLSEPVISGNSPASISVDVRESAADGADAPAIPEVANEPDEAVLLEDFVEVVEEVPLPVTHEPIPLPSELVENPVLAERRRGGSTSDTNQDANEVGAGSFAKEVEYLQESGLDIMFVFDSTGSMTRTIMDTKTTIVQMLDVLRTLVPDARVGLVTYRDRGKREDYLIRQVPLDLDYWRASNFVQFIVADGGGDLPEDVRAGLKAAFAQNWRSSARRVVVLAGDAPTHSRDLNRMLREVRAFAKNHSAFVHTLIANPDRAGNETVDQFQKIAEAGRGVCETIDNRDRILQRVLTLAFGKQYRQDMRRVIASVDRDRSRVDVASLHLVRKGGAPLVAALKKRPVSTMLYNALIRRPRQHAATTLLNLLDAPKTPLHTRHACAAAIQRIFRLKRPPIDPESGDPLPDYPIARIRSLIQQLPE